MANKIVKVNHRYIVVDDKGNRVDKVKGGCDTIEQARQLSKQLNTQEVVDGSISKKI